MATNARNSGVSFKPLLELTETEADNSKCLKKFVNKGQTKSDPDFFWKNLTQAACMSWKHTSFA